MNSLVVSSYTPDAARAGIPVIGIYYIFNIGLVSFSTAASIYVLNLHFKGAIFLFIWFSDNYFKLKIFILFRLFK